MGKTRNFLGILNLVISECLIPCYCTKVENFLANIALKSFPDCSLFFVLQNGAGSGGAHGKQINNVDLASVVLRRKVFAYYIVQLPHENYSFPINASFPVTVGGYNKRASVCKVVILNLDNLQPGFLTRVRRLLAPVYQPIVRTDVDPWIWITPNPALLEPLLLSSALPAKTKYKLGISLTPSGDLVIRTVCFFCGNGGTPQILHLPMMQPTEFNYFPDYVSNLNGKLLRLSAPDVVSLIEIDSSLPKDAVNNGKRGVWVSLFDEFLKIRLNFTYNMFISSGKDGERGGGTGTELQDGRWIGVVGDLMSGRAEIGILVSPTPDRLPHVSFTNSFFHVSCLTFTTGQGSRLFSPAALLWTFDLLMWTSVGVSTLSAFFVFKVLTTSMHWLLLDSGDASSFSRRGIVSKHEWEIKHQIFFTLTSYLDQNAVLPWSTPLRCFVALWLFFTLIITTIYRTKMVSLLAFPVLEKVPTTFAELAYSDSHVIFWLQGESGYNTLKASADPVYVKLVQEMDVVTGDGANCLIPVMDKKASCIAFASSMTYIIARNLSDGHIRSLATARDSTYNMFVGLTLEGGSVYKENVERWLRWTRPFHFANVWEERDMDYNIRLGKRAWWKETNQTDKLASLDVESDELTLRHISGAFYALVACLMVCAGILVYEIGYSGKIS